MALPPQLEIISDASFDPVFAVKELSRSHGISRLSPPASGGSGRRLRHHREMADPVTFFAVPRISASAGALIFDDRRRLLILKPTYKKGWTIPGGQIEADGETPWEACRRETLEECGLEITRGRLVCVDFLRPREGRRGGARFLFDCGVLSDERLAAIRLQAAEIQAHRLVDLDEAQELLSGPVGRRVLAAVGAQQCLYLEDGRPVEGVDADGASAR